MKKLIFALTIIIMACGDSEKPLTKKQEKAEQINRLQEKLYNTKDQAAPDLDRKSATEVVKLYKQFADTFPEDPRAPEYLFKGAEVSIALGQYHQALSFLESCFKKYEKYERRPDCLYMQGFIYDNYLEYHAMAKETYERVMKEFPNHSYAKDARAAIETLTMSDEELIRMFKEKENQRQDSIAAAS